jgi:hypothetical protein
MPSARKAVVEAAQPSSGKNALTLMLGKRHPGED